METTQTFVGLGRELAQLLLNGLSERQVSLTILPDPAKTNSPPHAPFQKLRAILADLPQLPTPKDWTYSREKMYEGLERE